MAKTYVTRASPSFAPVARPSPAVRPAVQTHQAHSGDSEAELARADRFGHHLSGAEPYQPPAAIPANPPIQGMFSAFRGFGKQVPRLVSSQSKRPLHFGNPDLRRILESTPTGKKLIGSTERLERETVSGSAPVEQDPDLGSTGLYQDNKISYRGAGSLSDSAIEVGHEIEHRRGDLGSGQRDPIEDEYQAHLSQIKLTGDLLDQGATDISSRHTELHEDYSERGPDALHGTLASYHRRYFGHDQPEADEAAGEFLKKKKG